MNIQEPKDLADLKDLSVRMGGNPLLIQASGGNTSLKEAGVLWVKASGKSLINALKEELFLPLDLDQVLAEVHNPADGSTPLKSLSGSLLRPSIETTLHALMPHRVVLHSHSVDVIAQTLQVDGQKQLGEKLEGLAWHWVPYCRPGKPLMRAIATALKTRQADVLVLANHGLVVGGDTPQAAEALQTEVVQRLQISRREYPQPDLRSLYHLIEQLPELRLPAINMVHALATDSWSFNLAQRNPAYPDHVVFCGVRPFVVYGVENILKSVTALVNEWGQDVTYILIPGIGVILLQAATQATEAMLQAQAEVLLRIPEGAEVNFLSDSQCAELINWDAEKYRKALERTARP